MCKRTMLGYMVYEGVGMTTFNATQRVTNSGWPSYRHSNNDGRFNADIGVVTFKDGKVVSVEFLPD